MPRDLQPAPRSTAIRNLTVVVGEPDVRDTVDDTPTEHAAELDGNDVAVRRPMVVRSTAEARTARRNARAVFTRWFGKDYDLQMLDVVMAVTAVEQLDGDPVWLLVVSGPGNAKTETVQVLAGIGAHVTSTISSEGALLSATSRKETAKNATGGLLRKIGPHGVLVVKDVTSVLSMNRDLRATVLAALREVYDGFWERNVGTDGGRTLTWEGRLIVVGAVTTAWDTHHAAVAALGDRFALVRTDSRVGRQDAGRQALANVGHEVEMRADLQSAVTDVLAGLDREAAVLSEYDAGVLLGMADLVTRARTAVEHDGRGDPTEAHMPEMPTRFAKGLGQIVRGALAVGLDRDDALAAAIRVARDSLPPLRLELLRTLQTAPGSSCSDVMRMVQRPRSTVDRGLQELHLLGLASVTQAEHGWRYQLTKVVAVDVLDALTSVNATHLAVMGPNPTIHPTSQPLTGKVSTGGAGVKERGKQARSATDIPGDSASPRAGGEATANAPGELS